MRAEALDREPINAAVLHAVLERRDAVLPSDIAARVGLSEQAVRRELDRLERRGCDIETTRDRGAKLVRTSLAVWSDYLRWRCGQTPDAAARVIEVYRTIGSTQDAARRQAESLGAKARGGVAVAGEQTAGRGRLGRRWVAPPGGCLTFSMVHLAQTGARLSIDRLMFATSIALAETVESLALPATPQVRIKWPNDVLIGERKLAGILVETFATPAGNAAIIGVGLNVGVRENEMPDDIRARATSLSIAGVVVDRLLVLAEAVRAIDTTLIARDDASLVKSWRERSALLQRSVHLRHNGTDIHGQVVDLDPFEGLIVRTRQGQLIHLPAASTTVEAW